MSCFHKHDVVTLCRDLIAIDSINPFEYERLADGEWKIGGNEKEMLDFCASYLKKSGFETERQDCGFGRENLLAQKGEGTHSVLLYAHVDTVEVKEGWTREEALQATLGSRVVDGVEQEVLFGLGSNDMKGGVAVVLRAAAQWIPRGFRLKVVFGCDEEFWSLGSHFLVHHSDFLDDVVGVLVPEVGESASEPNPDCMLVTLGRCGRTELLLEIPGSGGHGAEPEGPHRVNAITQAATIALAIEAYSQQLPTFVPFEGQQTFVKSSALVTQLRGGSGTLSVPDRATMLINRVLIPGETPTSAQEDLQCLIDELYRRNDLQPIVFEGKERRVTLATRERPTPPLYPYRTHLEEPFVRSATRSISQFGRWEAGMGVSVADENRFGGEANKPVVVLGPRGENSHAAYEWVTTQSLHKLEQVYLAILHDMEWISS